MHDDKVQAEFSIFLRSKVERKFSASIAFSFEFHLGNRKHIAPHNFRVQWISGNQNFPLIKALGEFVKKLYSENSRTFLLIKIMGKLVN